MSESYTPGHTENATSFMSERSLDSHGQFVLPLLSQDQHVLDAGCGPGTIPIDIARKVRQVNGIDFGANQFETAKDNAAKAKIDNAHFQRASAYEIPFDDESFDLVIGHALMEHLAEPQRAMAEFLRVLKPGGAVAVCSPDFDGWLLAPESEELLTAARTYADLQAANGGDLRIGKKLASLLSETGFEKINTSARYECYPSLTFIGDYLALQLEKAGQHDSAQTFRTWSQSEIGMFAQSWVSAVGKKPT